MEKSIPELKAEFVGPGLSKPKWQYIYLYIYIYI